MAVQYVLGRTPLLQLIVLWFPHMEVGSAPTSPIVVAGNSTASLHESPPKT
jgi:hypothetical protein